MKQMLANSWKVAMNQGAGKTLRVLLLRMLKMMLKAYHSRT